jgi:hypothetical protein
VRDRLAADTRSPCRRHAFALPPLRVRLCIFTIDCTLRASARHLASAGCRVVVRGEPAGFIFISKLLSEYQ